MTTKQISQEISIPEIVEELSEILASQDDMDSALRHGLQLLLEKTQRASGAVVVQMEDDRVPMLVVNSHLPTSWVKQLEQEGSWIRNLCHNKMEATGIRIEQRALGSGLAIPLLSSSGQQGVFLLPGKAEIFADDLVFEKAARVFGKVIFIGRKYQITQDQTQASETLDMVFSGLITDITSEDVQNKVVLGIRDGFMCEAASMALLDMDHGLLIKKTIVTGSDWIYQASIQADQGLAGVCLSTGSPLMIVDPTNDERYKESIDSVPNLKIHTLLCVPLKAAGRVIGVLQLLNKKSGPFISYDQHLLTALGNSIASLLEYQKTIQQLRVLNAHLEASRWELARSRNTLRSLFDNIPESIYIIDNMFRLIAVNMARSKRAGKEPNVLVGRYCYEALYQRTEPCPGCLVAETFYTRKITHRTERQWINEGEPQEWQISIYPIVDEMDQVTQAILFETDVTEKNRMEAILAQSEKMAAVGQLAAGIAHEINNPLTVILANAQLLQRDLPQDEDLHESVDLISRAGTRALYVVRNLLNFARKEKYEFVPTDINDTIRRSLEMLQHELLSRGINLDFEPDNALPRVMASADHLQGVWLNIILNAMDATERGQANIRVTTSLQGSEIRIMIVDQGKGISQENLKRIFEPFYTTKEPGRGTGLGLSVCHRIVKQHGGHVLVDSKIDQGTTFTVVLPVY
jgi:two-component system NtrC family sensor kinase